MKRPSIVDCCAVLILALSASAAAAAPASGDAAKGEGLFKARCAACHQIGANAVGPDLKGVVGRKAGTAPGFGYTPALKRLGGLWTPAALEVFLRDPSAKAPGTAMPISVQEPEARADLIAYLARSR